jgi:hypothetical protein
MPRGGRNVPGLQQRWALKGKLLVKKYKGKLVVQSWPKPYGKARSEAQANTQKAFQRFQRAVKFFPPQQIITAMELTKSTGMYPRDLMMAASLGTNVMLGYDEPGALPVIGDGLEKFTATGGETTIDWTNIPPGYSALELIINGRALGGGSFDSLLVTFNGDTAAHYDSTVWFNPSGVGQVLAGNTATICALNGNSCPANYPTAARCLLPAYNSPFYKQGIATYTRIQAVLAGNWFTEQQTLWWRSTATIARLTLTLPTGFVKGSTVTLYGLF